MRYLSLILLVLVCFTLQDLKNEGCKALCQRDGYDNGSYVKSECICSEGKGTYEDFKHRRVKIPRGWNEKGELSVAPPQKFITHEESD